MKINFLILGVVVFSVISCKKEKHEVVCNEDSFKEVQFLPLKDGNYWVYAHQTRDTLNNIISSSNKLDTITVIGDSVVAGVTYKYLKSSGATQGLILPTLLRYLNSEILRPYANESSGNYEGEEAVVFSLFMDTLISIDCMNASWAQPCKYEVGNVRKEGKETIYVPAGTYDVSTIHEVVIKNDNGTEGWPYWGVKRNNKLQFANKIGLVRREYFFVSSTNVNEYRLHSYNLN